MAEVVIRAEGLTKRYGAQLAVDHVDLEVRAGEIVGILGPNGSGKTTTIRLLLDLLRPTSGSASILGFDCHRQGLDVRRRLGYLPAEMPMYPDQTGAGYLAFLSALGPPPSRARLDVLFHRFNVSNLDLRRKMRDYSHGMKRKLGLVQALMTEPPVLVLDEPTSGLDPLMIEAFAETIDELARAGRTTVLLSSHVLSEVDRVCTRIGLVRNGRLSAVQTLSELRAMTPRRLTVQFSRPTDALPPASSAWTIVAREPQRWVLDVRGPIGALVSTLSGLPVADITLEPYAAEDALLRFFTDAP